MDKAVKCMLIALGIIVLLCLLGCAVYFTATPSGRAAWNTYTHTLHKADDSTLYETRQKVEDTCRAMQASYMADKLVWEQYRGSVEKEERSWAQQAMMRANKTAVSYNEYVLKNSYVWTENVPEDIAETLVYLEEGDYPCT